MFRSDDTPHGEVERPSFKCTQCEDNAAEILRKDGELASLRKEIEALKAELRSRDFVATL